MVLLIDVLTVITSSLGSVLERVWVNFLMIAISFILPDDAFVRLGITRSILIVVALTALVLWIRELLVSAFKIDSSGIEHDCYGLIDQRKIGSSSSTTKRK